MPSRYVTLVLVLSLALTLPAAAVDPAAPFSIAPGLFQPDAEQLGLKQIPSERTLLYQPTEDGHKFCHHANLVVFRSEMYCMWSNGLEHEDAPGQRVFYCRSTDGREWTEPTLLTEHNVGDGYCVAGGFLVDGERLIAFYTGTGASNFHPDTALLARTTTDGRNWSEPLRITEGFFIDGPWRLPGGRMFLAGEHVGARRESGRMRLLSTSMQDGLGGWEESSIAVQPLNNFGYTEPCPFLRPDGTLILPFRNYSGYLYASTSSDDGRTWTDPVQTDFPDSLARFSCGNLPDGTAFMISNSSPKRLDRSLLTIALSSDGVTFDRAWLVRGEPTEQRFSGKHKINGWQYPHALIWNSELYIAHSINKEDVGVTRIALENLGVKN